MRQEASDRITPFDNNDGILVGKFFGEIVLHEAGIGQAVKIIMRQGLAILGGVGFRNGEARAGNFCGNTEAFGEATRKCSLTGANITDELDDCGRSEGGGYLLAEVKHLLF